MSLTSLRVSPRPVTKTGNGLLRERDNVGPRDSFEILSFCESSFDVVVAFVY